MIRYLVACLVIATIGTGYVNAGKVMTALIEGKAAFASGTCSGMAVTSDGNLRVVPRVDTGIDLNSTYAWSLAVDQESVCFVGTGTEGKLLKVPPSGVPEVVYQETNQHLFALAVDGENGLLMGTGPRGAILRRAASGKVQLWCDTGESYVWSLRFDSRRNEIWAGTGPHGIILRIAADGRILERIATGQTHVQSLALSAREEVFAGTAPRGIVYRIGKSSMPVPIFQATQPEITALIANDQHVVVGASGTTKGSDGKTPGKANTGNAATSECTVTLVDGSGRAIEVWKSAGMVHQLSFRQGSILAALGGSGASLMEINPRTRTATEVARLDHAEFPALAFTPDDQVLLLGSDPGRLYRMSWQYAASEGEFLSALIDAGRRARWGRLEWHVENARSVLVDVRTGNTTPPDSSWSEWHAITERGGQAAHSFESRFLQVRVRLQSGESPALLRKIKAHYQQLNLPPEISSLELPTEERSPDEVGKKLKVKWTASDPNEDNLTFALYCRKEGWPDWIELASDLRKNEYEWDAMSLPSGEYRLKVVASDHLDNPPGEAASSERISSPLLLDRTPPKVRAVVVRLEQNRAVVEAEAADNHSRLASAGFSVDGGEWTPVFPSDGLFDSSEKKFVFKTTALRPGTHLLIFKVMDASGNVGAADFVFEVTQASRPNPAAIAEAVRALP